MVVTISMSGVITGILASGLALVSGLSLLGAIIAYCLTGSVAVLLIVGALALRPAAPDDEAGHEAQTV